MRECPCESGDGKAEGHHVDDTKDSCGKRQGESDDGSEGPSVKRLRYVCTERFMVLG